MFLSDRDLRARLTRGDLVVRPLDDAERQVQPASIDLRLGNDFLVFQNVHLPVLRVNEPGLVEKIGAAVRIEDDDEFILHPGEFALGSTYEWVEIPNDLVAKVEGRSSLGRLAVIVHATAGFIDPGFKGTITLELSNLGKVPVALKPKMRISQIALAQMTSPAERPYGEARGSKYQGQRGPVGSRIAADFDAKR